VAEHTVKDLMKAKVSAVFILALIVLAGVIVAIYPRIPTPPSDPPHPAVEYSYSTPQPHRSEPQPTPPVEPAAPAVAPTAPLPPSTPSVAGSSRLDRLNQIREEFRTLAGGPVTNALQAARSIIDPTERETALLTLVTEWTHGELRPPQQRAGAIAALGLEAGLGLELAANPELALLWANEMTEGPGRRAIVREVAVRLVGSDPAAAFALNEQLPTEERRNFIGSLFAAWGSADTEAAMKWAGQMPDPAARDEALRAIRTTAPVGIGAALRVADGYPVINDLVPGAPAELSGQIRPGDRIVALAQGDNSFIDAHNVPLEKIVEMVRGAPNTILQIQVVSADAPPSSAPRTVAILRDQIKFKR
jgi:hypothetical protein